MENEKSSFPSLFVVIPVHNRRDLTRACLQCLSKQTWAAFHIIIVDDGSSDGTGKMILEEFPQVILLRGDGDLWWTRSINLGVKEALSRGADYILTLNDDTEPPFAFIEQILAGSETHPLTLIGCCAVSIKTGEIVYTGENLNWLTAKNKKVPPVQEGDNPLVPVSHFPGRGLLIPAQVFHEIGLYDNKHFPQMVADVDLTLRASRAGYSIYCHQGIKLPIHVESSTGGYYVTNRSLKNYWRHLSAIKGGGNLGVFFWFAVKNCPKKYLLIFLAVGLTRRVLGYWKLR